MRLPGPTHLVAMCATESRAREALRRIGALYAVEAELRGQPAEVRAKGRQARAGPQLETFRAWLQTTLSQVSQKSALAEAIR